MPIPESNAPDQPSSKLPNLNLKGQANHWPIRHLTLPFPLPDLPSIAASVVIAINVKTTSATVIFSDDAYFDHAATLTGLPLSDAIALSAAILSYYLSPPPSANSPP
jgi:hypothetical protein